MLSNEAPRSNGLFRKTAEVLEDNLLTISYAPSVSFHYLRYGIAVQVEKLVIHGVRGEDFFTTSYTVATHIDNIKRRFSCLRISTVFLLFFIIIITIILQLQCQCYLYVTRCLVFYLRPSLCLHFAMVIFNSEKKNTVSILINLECKHHRFLC